MVIKKNIKGNPNTKMIPKKGRPRSTDAGAKLRMKMVFEDWKANGQKGLGKSMIKNGYSPATAQNSGQMVKSKTWQEIMNEAMPDSLLAERHTELLNARHKIVVKEKEYDEDGGYQMVDKLVDLGPDVSAVSKGLEMAYKLKGAFNPKDDGEGSRPNQSTIYNLFYKPEIRNSVKQLEAALTKQLYGEPIKDDDGEIPANFGGVATTTDQDGVDGSGGFDGGDPAEDGVVEK